MNFTDYGCVAIVVMTRGGNQGLLMATDHTYNELQILDFFKHKKKPQLVTKPVILIIQVSLDRIHCNTDCLFESQ